MENTTPEGCRIARQVFEKFGEDVFLIARNVGVKIVYEKWFPVTNGEFDRKNRTIVVNLNAAEKIEKIIAHELGHFFAQDLNLEKTVEESFARDFADYFVDIKNHDVLEKRP